MKNTFRSGLVAKAKEEYFERQVGINRSKINSRGRKIQIIIFWEHSPYAATQQNHSQLIQYTMASSAYDTFFN
jgi:hypothetical protein